MKKYLLTLLTFLHIISPDNSDVIKLQNEINQVKLRLENSLHLSGFAPLPGPTVEGTSTAGWTDDGTVVRLNTQSDNVGIGTLSPSMKLQVQGNAYITGTLDMAGGSLNLSNGSGTTTLTTLTSGFIGVGSTTPRASFAIGGNLMANGTTTLGTLVLASSSIQIGGVPYILPTADGTNGQVLTTNGSRVLSFGTVTVTSANSLAIASSTPSATVNLAVNGGALIGATTTVSTLAIASSTLQANGLTYQLPSTQAVNNGYGTTTTLINNGTGGLTWGIPVSIGATSTNPGFVNTNGSVQVINHGLGRIPSIVEIYATTVIDNAGTPELSTSFGAATSSIPAGISSQFATNNAVRAAATIKYRTFNRQNSIIWFDDSGSTNRGEADLIDLTATTFTLTWVTNPNQSKSSGS